MYRVFVTTAKQYYWALQPFAHLFCKYWSELQPVIVAGYEPFTYPLPANFKFYSIDKETYPVEQWSDGVIKFLKAMSDDVFVYMLEDMWLVRTVDVRTVSTLVEYMRQHPEVMRIDLTADRLYAGGSPGQHPEYAYHGSIDLIWSEPTSPYHLSLQAAIWRREYLLHYMKPGETPWDFEMWGTTRLSSTPEVVVLGTRQLPVRYTLTLKSDEPDKPQVTGMRKKDFDYLVQQGWVDEGALT